jgi:Tfp pilus assembly protein PilW
MGIGILIGSIVVACAITVYQSWRFRLDREEDQAWFEQDQEWWRGLRERQE